MGFAGRQPKNAQITPSNWSPWYGSIIPDDPLTTQQRADLDKRRLPQDQPRMLVYRQASSREMWWPDGGPPPVFEFECPIIGHRLDKVRIIAPSGEAKLVQGDGWVSRPHRLNRNYIEQRRSS